MNKPEWVFCRNCVAWREMLVCKDAKVVVSHEFRVCRLKCDNVDNFRHGDDGCCEGIPKVAGGAA